MYYVDEKERPERLRLRRSERGGRVVASSPRGRTTGGGGKRKGGGGWLSTVGVTTFSFLQDKGTFVYSVSCARLRYLLCRRAEEVEETKRNEEDHEKAEKRRSDGMQSGVKSLHSGSSAPLTRSASDPSFLQSSLPPSFRFCEKNANLEQGRANTTRRRSKSKGKE